MSVRSEPRRGRTLSRTQADFRGRIPSLNRFFAEAMGVTALKTPGRLEPSWLVSSYRRS